MRQQVYISEEEKWLQKALEDRVEAKRLVGDAKANVSREIKEILKEALKDEFEKRHGPLPESQKYLSLTSNTNRGMKKRSRKVTITIPEEEDGLLEDIERYVRCKRESQCPTTLESELLLLLEIANNTLLYPEIQDMWYKNTEALGYDVSPGLKKEYAELEKEILNKKRFLAKLLKEAEELNKLIQKSKETGIPVETLKNGYELHKRYGKVRGIRNKKTKQVHSLKSNC